jgi:hypothetical protein
MRMSLLLDLEDGTRVRRTLVGRGEPIEGT